MAIETTLSFYPYFPGNIDSRLGPYSSSAHATGSIELIYRYPGMTVFVSSSTETSEYWWKDGTNNNQLILKTSPSSGSFSGIYSSSLSGSGAVTIDDVGGINANTSVDNLEGKNFSALFDEIFFPVVLPTAQPAGSSTTIISATAGSGGSGTTREVGATVNVTLTTTFNQGTWRAGTLTSTERDYYGEDTNYYFTSGSTTAEQINSTYIFNNHIITLGSNTFTSAVSHSAGQIPVNSRGIEVPPSQSEGYLGPNSVLLTGVYPYFYGSSSADTFNISDVVTEIEDLYNGNPTAASKTVASSIGNITGLFYNNSPMWCWFAHPTSSTPKNTMFQNTNNTNTIGPAETFDNNGTSNINATGYWTGIGYRIYITNAKTVFNGTPNQYTVQLQN
jgi:hypothetical protein